MTFAAVTAMGQHAQSSRVRKSEAAQVFLAAVGAAIADEKDFPVVPSLCEEIADLARDGVERRSGVVDRENQAEIRSVLAMRVHAPTLVPDRTRRIKREVSACGLGSGRRPRIDERRLVAKIQRSTAWPFSPQTLHQIPCVLRACVRRSFPSDD